MTRNQNAASTSSSYCREELENVRTMGEKAKENICQTSRSGKDWWRFWWPKIKFVFTCRVTGTCGTGSGSSGGSNGSLYGNSAADIKGRSCCKWLVLWRNENVAPSSQAALAPSRCCFPQRAEPLRRVVALGYEKSLVIIDACENSLESHTCPSVLHPQLQSLLLLLLLLLPLPPPHWSAINYATCCVLRLPHEYRHL